MSGEAKLSLFPTLCEGDLKIFTLLKRAILLVGESRTGKSTAFRWLDDSSIIGEKKGARIIYVNQSDGAEVSPTALSQTLTPNIINLKSEISLVDCAGFNDKRGYVGVICVSAMLKALIENIQEVKFIVVVNSSALIDFNVDKLIIPFDAFLNIFSFNSLEKNVQQKLAKSVSLLVTKT